MRTEILETIEAIAKTFDQQASDAMQRQLTAKRLMDARRASAEFCTWRAAAAQLRNYK